MIMPKSEKILKMLAKIPQGRVTTYGALAKAARSSPRAVGQIMRRNPRPELYPCFKVVKSDGDIGGYGGCVKGSKVERKISLLKKDGIKIRNGKIDLEKYLHKF